MPWRSIAPDTSGMALQFRTGMLSSPEGRHPVCPAPCCSATKDPYAPASDYPFANPWAFVTTLPVPARMAQSARLFAAVNLRGGRIHSQDSDIRRQITHLDRKPNCVLPLTNCACGSVLDFDQYGPERRTN
jgi:hypothetical protein